MRLYVPLNRQEFEALERLAHAERRRPQDQAAVLLAQTLSTNPPRAAIDSASGTEGTPSRTSREAERVSA
jgi:hypothetical protein